MVSEDVRIVVDGFESGDQAVHGQVATRVLQCFNDEVGIPVGFKGNVFRGPAMSLDEPIKDRMSEVLEEIRSGSFADEWSNQQPTAAALFEKIREARDKMPMAKWDQVARAAFKIGNAG